MDFETDITDEGTKENYSNIPNACWGGGQMFSIWFYQKNDAIFTMNAMFVDYLSMLI
jgi:hypothetical protein